MQLFPIAVSPHYLGKLKPHKTAQLEANCHSFLLLKIKNGTTGLVSRFLPRDATHAIMPRQVVCLSVCLSACDVEAR